MLPVDQLEVLAKRIFQPDVCSPSALCKLLMLTRYNQRRYIKDPSLPYYALISVINKFPLDGDSRMYWNYGTRDTLYSTLSQRRRGNATDRHLFQRSRILLWYSLLHLSRKNGNKLS